MKIGRILILIALILIVGLAGAFLWIQKASQPATPAGEAAAVATPMPQNLQEVVIAAQPIRRGTRITEDMVTTIELPTEKVLAVQLRDPKEAIGKIAVRDLAQGMFLTQGDVAEKLSVSAEGSLASLQIPPGYVAISIPLSRLSGVAYALRPGDHVAVLASFPFVDVDQEYQSILPNRVAVVAPPQVTDDGQTITGAVQMPASGEIGDQVPGVPRYVLSDGTPLQGRVLADNALENVPFYVVPSEPQRARLVSQMLIKDAAVLYVGTFPLKAQIPVASPPQQEQQAAEGEKQGEGEQKQPQQQGQQQQQTAQNQQPAVPPDIITLVVSPQEAVTLKYLMDRQVMMTLALRAGGDTTDISTEAVTLSYVLNAYGVVVPAKLPYDIAPRLDQVIPPVLENDRVVEPPR